jgi:hypothetical protein
MKNTEATKGNEMMKTHERTLTAVDPNDYIRRMQDTIAKYPSVYPAGTIASVASIDGKTKSGRTRFVMRITYP